MDDVVWSAILVADVHVSDKAPRSRLDDYTETVFTKLREINQIAATNRVNAILQCGDFFHVKSPSKVSHALVERSIDVLNSSMIKWYITPGNHDLPHGNLAQLPRTPLGVLFSSRAAKILVPDQYFRVHTDVDGIGVDRFIQVHGAQFTYHMDKDDEKRQVYYPEENDPSLKTLLKITVSHGTLIHGQGSFFGNYTNPRMLDLDRCADVTFNGHLHFGFPNETIEYNGRTLSFVNPGSVMRGSLDEYNRNFVPKVVLLEVNSLGEYSLTDIPLESPRPVDEVLNFSAKDSKQVEDERIAEYVSHLSTEIAEFAGLSGYDELITLLAKMDLSDPVKLKAQELLEVAYESSL